jgi:NTP pyrophosphatase (non-canonical NTP hydrolase)
MNEEEIFRKALDKWGVVAQLDMLVEECAELIKAVQKWKRSGNFGCTPDAFVEEFVDVQIMMAQIRLCGEPAGTSFDKLAGEVREKKMSRLERLVG